MNVNETTVKALDELIKQCYESNRIMDRLVSVLGVKFAMNNTADLLHEHIAHLFPKLSDEVAEKCLERYNIAVEYGSTQEGKQDYESVQEIILKVQDIVIGFQNMLIGCCTVANENHDIHIYADLLDILEDYNEVVGQVILLNDKVKLYNGNMASYDAHIKEHFWTLG